ncbi:hypothetical protein Ahy_A01g000565 [Arachis hypogaea]|uniref:Aminotransferase-like plant mobile domain-containing protein n=1 Tax=Arachis hypogaea TaxID=3818 RepID=A0A445EKI2_ARAHY|nr:hypothetical protein Ahy_A01g000565 [Arachis hypogaea]
MAFGDAYFYILFRKYTIMLQDVAYQLGIPIDAEYDTFSKLPQGIDKDTVRRYARAYIMMLLSTQLFGDKSGTHFHICWLPYIARLEDMGRYSWGSVGLSWLYWSICHVANRNVIKLAGPL